MLSRISLKYIRAPSRKVVWPGPQQIQRKLLTVCHPQRQVFGRAAQQSQRQFSGRNTLQKRMQQQQQEDTKDLSQSTDEQATLEETKESIPPSTDSTVAGSIVQDKAPASKVDVANIPEEMLRLTRYGREDFFKDYRANMLQLENEMREQADLELVELSEEKMNELSKVEQYKKRLEMQEKHKDIVLRVEKEIESMGGKLLEETLKQRNTHEKLALLNDMLEAHLEAILRHVPKYEYRNVDNTPKHLLHMTEEDLRPKTAEEKRADLDELIKEAKTKIVPVQMNVFDRRKYILPKEKMDPNELIHHLPDGMRLLDKEDISLEVLRKIQDKKLELDLEYEKTRDLYEKQRVIDQYLEEHQEDNEVLNSYYQNKYYKSRQNNHVKHIYDNTFDLQTIKFGILSGFFSTSVMTGCLFFVHPYLAALSLPDWGLLFAFCGFYANHTVHSIVLDRDKQSVHIERINFLGFETGQSQRVMVRDILHTGEYKNEYMSFDYFGLPPSVVKMLSKSASYLKKDPRTGDARSESVPHEDKNTFKHFTSFMAQNQRFLIPLDSPNFKDAVITEDLLNHVIHGRQKAVFDFDYSALEEQDDRMKQNMERLLEIKNDQHNEINFTTETQRKRREYQYYHPSRDFGDDLPGLQPKKVDNGEFWDNGYR